MKPSSKSSIIIGVVLLSGNPMAFAKDACPRLYFELNKSIAQGFVPEITKQEIQSLFQRTDLGAAEKAQQAFNLVFEERLKLLDPATQRYMRDTLENKVNLGSTPTLSGFTAQQNSISGSVSIVVPDSLRGSVLQYVILLHELEHAVQTAKNLPKGPVASFLMSMRETALDKFDREVGAMLAEHQYLANIPLPDRQKVIQQIREIESSGADDTALKTTLIALLNSQEPQPARFVRSQHVAMRYSKSDLLAKENAIAKRTRDARRDLSIMGGGVGLIVLSHEGIEKIRAICVSQFEETHSGSTRDPYYVPLCGLFSSLRKIDRDLESP